MTTTRKAGGSAAAARRAVPRSAGNALAAARLDAERAARALLALPPRVPLRRLARQARLTGLAIAHLSTLAAAADMAQRRR